MVTEADYCPPGWTRERMIRASSEELGSWTDEQRERFQEGAREELGDEGFAKFRYKMMQSWQARHRENKVPDPPNFLRTLQRLNYGVAPFPEWGFVVYRTAGYGAEDEENVRTMKQRWKEIIEQQFVDYFQVEGIPEALRNMRFRWMEDAALAESSPDELAEKYRRLDASHNFKHNAFLWVDQASMDSILNSPMPRTDPRRFRKEVPFVNAVSIGAGIPVEKSEDPDEEVAGADFRGYFRVAVESLISQFYDTIASDSRSLYEMGGFLSELDIYCDHTRYGVHKHGVGYCDMRGGPID